MAQAQPKSRRAFRDWPFKVKPLHPALGCEITGITQTPDGTTMFVNIQHPGEAANERSDPDKPNAVSSWPDGGRPRSATIVIQKVDGGVIGS